MDFAWRAHVYSRRPISYLEGGRSCLTALARLARFALARAGGYYDCALRLRLGFAGQKFFRRSHDAVIPICDKAANLIETRERAGDFKERARFVRVRSRTLSK